MVLLLGLGLKKIILKLFLVHILIMMNVIIINAIIKNQSINQRLSVINIIKNVIKIINLSGGVINYVFLCIKMYGLY